MRPGKIIVITHELVTPPDSLKNDDFSHDESQLIVELKRGIYPILCNPQNVSVLVPAGDRCEKFGWELVKNCPQYRYQKYVGFGDIVYDICDTVARSDAYASFVVVPMSLFNHVCRQIHATFLNKWHDYGYEPWKLADGAVALFDQEAKKIRVTLLGCLE
ncbi:MAG: hypothetical protein WC457_03980 [Patescibacteria group bacterium]